MTKLNESDFKPVSKRDAAITQATFDQYLDQLPGWLWSRHQGVNIIEKVYRCDDFDASMSQAQSVAELAESYDHHPMITIEWGRTRIAWWTHVIDGVHMNDLVLAAKTEMLLTR